MAGGTDSFADVVSPAMWAPGAGDPSSSMGAPSLVRARVEAWHRDMACQHVGVVVVAPALRRLGRSGAARNLEQRLGGRAPTVLPL